MKVLQLLVFILGFIIVSNAQIINKATLSGSVYDAYGALIPDVKFTATSQTGEKFGTLTNDEGIYTLTLPYAKYNPKTSHSFKMTKYEITVDGTKLGFQKYTIKDFNFVPSSKGSMQIDFALDVNAALKVIQSEPIQENNKP